MACSFSVSMRKEFILFSTIPNSCSTTSSSSSSSSSSFLSFCCSSYSCWYSNSSQRVCRFRAKQDQFGTPKKSLVFDKKNNCKSGVELITHKIDLVSENGPNLEWKSKKKPLWRELIFGSKKIKSIVLLNVIAVVYASDIMVIKEAESVMNPAAFSAVRFAMSAIPFLPFVFRARDDTQTRKAGLELGCWLSLAYFIEAIALLTSEAARASFISLVTVISVPLFDGMLGAIIPARTWFGVLMSVVGFVVLECGGSSPNIGDLLNFLSAIFFGIHMLRTEHISRSTEKENLLALVGYQAIVVAGLSTLWALFEGCFDCQQDLNQSTQALTELWDWVVTFPWIPAIYTGIFSTGICTAIEFAAMREVSATETAIIYGLEPIWGAGFAWFLLGERWGILGWIGATLIIGGSLMVQLYGCATTTKSIEAKENNHKPDLLMAPQEQMIKNGLSASPIVIRSRKNVEDIFM